MKKYNIQEVTKIVGMPSSTLRFYESKGLLPDIERTESGYRLYTDEDIELLELIDCLRKTNMSLKEISRYLELQTDGDETLDERYKMLLARKKAVQQEIKQLHNASKAIDEKMDELSKEIRK